jgi:5-methyltetrahydrofolate--homocysteine methyltransferase
MITIAERINASVKSVGEAIDKKDSDFITELAASQARAGADYIDVNAGTGSSDLGQGKEDMKWLINVVQTATDKPIAIDSDRPELIEAALSTYEKDKTIINSVTAEPEKLAAVGPMAAGRQAYLVALAMGTDGIPDNVKGRLDACEKIVKHLSQLGVRMDQIFFDPLVLPIATDSRQGTVTLKTIEEIKRRYPDAGTVIGLSNISYGLPKRKLINRAFLLMAASTGLDAAILDPLDAKTMSLVKVADMLTGKDASCRAYIRAHRKGLIVD